MIPLKQPDQYLEKKEKAAAVEQSNKEKDASANVTGAIATAAPGGGPNGAKANPDEENICEAEDFSEASGVGGGHRFENLIKSMLARLELNNSLAPIQQYGRH